ncbi:MAG: YdcF family protein [Frankia sp.]|nr:YdcF family protein [Frankia sp.]
MVRRAVLVALGAVVVLLVASVRLFVFPDRDAPRRADAIVMFDGVGGRKAYAVALAEAGYAPVLAISTRDVPWCQRTVVPGVEVRCFVPDPATTQGEAEATARLAEENGWETVLVVVGRAQATRARIRLDRCFHGDLAITTVDPKASQWPRTIAYEWGALLKALVLQREC